MRALVTNDDGIESPGLVTLANAARAAGLDVVIAAPSWDSSGASSSITGVEDDGRLASAPRVIPGTDLEAHAVDGAPAMITVVAMQGAFGPPPALVLSGVNCGRNTGHAVLHSGTVGAALTAVNQGACGLAVSLDAGDPDHWDTAGHVAELAIRWLAEVRPGAVLNINVPDVDVADLRGLRACPLARVGAVQTTITERGEGYLHLSFEPPGPPEPGTDAACLAEGWAVATALRPFEGADDVDLDGLIASWPAP